MKGANMPVQPSARVAALLEKNRALRGRLIFALDATASRERMWDMAVKLQASMFEAAVRIGGLDVQLVYYRGISDFRTTGWLGESYELVDQMSAIRCEAGGTKIARVLAHIQAENTRKKINAAVFIGDAVEEPPQELYAAAKNINVPVFLFQEGDGDVAYSSEPQKVEQVFRELARLTGGAYGKFDAGAVKQLGDLLRAVAAFAVGGMLALAKQNTDSARALIGQMKT
jgi:hypothetical protein